MSVKAYKGFNKDLTCRGFQYKQAETYKYGGEVVKCASGGFHACESPLDVFVYYSPGSSVYYEVELDGNIDRDGTDSKICAEEITIGLKLELPEFISRAEKFIIGKVERNIKKNDLDGSFKGKDHSAASNTGYCSAASNTGDYSAASNTGRYSAASNTGRYSAASNTGRYSAASNTGDRSAASNTGYYSAASNTGDYSAASVEGEDSVAFATGKDSKAKACVGSAIVLCYRDEEYKLVHIKSAIIDGEVLKPETFYSLNAFGEFFESE